MNNTKVSVNVCVKIFDLHSIETITRFYTTETMLSEKHIHHIHPVQSSKAKQKLLIYNKLLTSHYFSVSTKTGSEPST